VTSAIATGLDAILPASTAVAAWIAWPPAEYMVQTAGWFAAIPFASANINQVASTETAIPWYLALFAFTPWLAKRPVPEEPVDHFSLPLQRLAPALGLATLAGLAAILAWHALAHDHEGRVSVTVLDVGQGEAILVEDAVGHRVLVDGGPNSQGIREALSRHLPFDDRRIDVVVLTHPQADHLGGLLEVLDSYNVSIVLDSSASVDSDLRDAWAESLTGSVPTVSAARRGQRIELAGGTLDIVAPAHDPAYKTLDLNDHSTILRLSVGEISFLLTGDLGNDGEHLLMRSGEDVRADVLKVGHHGSRFSSSAEFLSRVDPSVSLISVGMDNPYGHPSQEVLGRLDESLLYRTDESGDITVSTDGTRLWVDTER
jgi:competence protein ComEC